MPSKYDGVFHKLKELPTEVANADKGIDYQDKVNIVKTAIREKTPNITARQLAERISVLRKNKEKLELDLKDNELALEAISQMLIAASDDSAWGEFGAAKNCIRLVTGEKIELRKEPYAQVVDRDENRQWAIKEGLERMLMLPWQTLNSLTKERLLKGESEPPGVKAWVRSKICFTKGTANAEE